MEKQNPVSHAVKEVGQVADTTVKEAGTIGGDIIGETGKLGVSAEHAVTNVGSGAIHGVDKMGSEAGSLGKKAVENVAALPHDVIKSAETGKPAK
ncbi:MAG: hypothetical protein ABI888_06975 [Chloroflexota bacterium]